MTPLPIRNTVEGSRPVAVLVRNRIADEASFTQEVTRTQRIQYHSLALSRDDSDLHFSSLNKIDRVRLVLLEKRVLRSCEVLPDPYPRQRFRARSRQEGLTFADFSPVTFLAPSIVTLQLSDYSDSSVTQEAE